MISPLPRLWRGAFPRQWRGTTQSLIIMFFTLKQALCQRSRYLRKNLTETELLLWSQLKTSRLGVRFRRQYVVGHYIVDFYCPRIKLIIEIDGSVHCSANAQKKDAIRDQYLRSMGCYILRYSTDQVKNQMQMIITDLENYVRSTG